MWYDELINLPIFLIVLIISVDYDFEIIYLMF